MCVCGRGGVYVYTEAARRRAKLSDTGHSTSFSEHNFPAI